MQSRNEIDESDMNRIFKDAIYFDETGDQQQVIDAAINGQFNFNRLVDLRGSDPKPEYTYLGHAIIAAITGTVNWEFINRLIDTQRFDTSFVYFYQKNFKKSVTELLIMANNFNPEDFSEGAVNLYKNQGGKDPRYLKSILPLDSNFQSALERYNNTHHRETSAQHPLREQMTQYEREIDQSRLPVFRDNINQLCILDELERYIRERITSALINVGRYSFHPHQIGDHDTFFQNYSGLALHDRFNASSPEEKRKIIETLSTSQRGGCLNATLEGIAEDIIHTQLATVDTTRQTGQEFNARLGDRRGEAAATGESDPETAPPDGGSNPGL